MRKAILISLALCLAFGACTAVAQEDAMLAAAQKLVPADAIHIRTHQDDGYIQVKFMAQGEEYEVKFLPNESEPFRLESERELLGASQPLLLDKEQAKEAIAAAWPDAEILFVFTEEDDHTYFNRVIFRTDSVLGTIELHPETFAVQERKIYFGTFNPPTEEDVLALLAEQAPQAVLSTLKLDDERGTIRYEGEATEGRTEYEFAIDIADGGLIEWRVDD